MDSRRAFALTLSLVCGGCGSSDVLDEGPPPDTRVHLFLTDAPIDDHDVTKVLVTFTHIEVYLADQEQWQTVIDYGAAGRTFDLLTLRDGVTDELGAFALEPGRYEQIRLHLVADNRIEVAGEMLPLKVPSGEQTGIKLVSGFEVTGNGPTSITVDFDAAASVDFTRGQGWLLKPTLKVIGVTTSDRATRVIGPAGGAVRVLGEAELVIPPDALMESTEITVRPVELEATAASEVGVVPTAVVELEPHGLTFAVPATLTLDLEAYELDPFEDLVLLNKGEAEPWTELPTTYDESGTRLSASIDHFSWAGAGYPVARIEIPYSYLSYVGDPRQLVEARPYDQYNRLLEGRAVSWDSSDWLRVGVGRWTQCPYRPATELECEDVWNHDEFLCRWDRATSTCHENQRYAELEARSPPGAFLTATSGYFTSAPKLAEVRRRSRVTVRVNSLRIIDDGDGFLGGAGELRWCITANGVRISCPRSFREYDDDDVISINRSVTLELKDHEALVFRAELEEDDDPAVRVTRTYRKDTNWGEGSHSNSFGDSPRGRVSWRVTVD